MTLTLSGKGEVRGADIDESLIKQDQKDIIQDLIVAAHADARRKLEVLLQERMQALTGGLPLPPGLKRSRTAGRLGRGSLTSRSSGTSPLAHPTRSQAFWSVPTARQR